MNKAASNVEAEAKNPQDQDNYEDRPEHKNFPFHAVGARGSGLFSAPVMHI
jgi:hypothetical protein